MVRIKHWLEFVSLAALSW